MPKLLKKGAKKAYVKVTANYKSDERVDDVWTHILDFNVLDYYPPRT